MGYLAVTAAAAAMTATAKPKQNNKNRNDSNECKVRLPKKRAVSRKTMFMYLHLHFVWKRIFRFYFNWIIVRVMRPTYIDLVRVKWISKNTNKISSRCTHGSVLWARWAVLCRTLSVMAYAILAPSASGKFVHYLFICVFFSLCTVSVLNSLKTWLHAPRALFSFIEKIFSSSHSSWCIPFFLPFYIVFNALIHCISDVETEKQCSQFNILAQYAICLSAITVASASIEIAK